MDGQWKRLFERRSIRFLLAAAAAVPPFVLRQGLAHGLGLSIPSDLFFWPVILTVALWLGFWPAVVTIVTGALLVDRWIVPPRTGFIPALPGDALALLAGVIFGIFMAGLAARYKTSIRRLEEMRTEQRLRASEGRFLKLLHESRDIVYRLNLVTGGYDYISSSAGTILGYSEAEYLQMTIHQARALLHPDDQQRVTDGLEAADRKGLVEIEYRVRHKDGSYRWVSNQIFVEYDEDGRPAFHEGNIRDITAAKAAQDALLRSATLASAGRMSATIAHEINNPLTAVTNLLFLAGSAEGLPERASNYLKQADAELQRIGLIARRALGFYRDTSAPELIQLDGLLDSCVDLFRRQIETRGASIVRDGTAGLGVVGRGGELRQVFINLVSNSLDAISKGGTIRIRVHQLRGYKSGASCIRILVADNGHGIAEAARPQIFEPFFTTKGSVGTGLGLWVSMQLMEKNGGRILMRSSSAEGRHGTVFVVEMPG